MGVAQKTYDAAAWRTLCYNQGIKFAFLEAGCITHKT